jgi:hypothetical protein
MTPAQQNIIHNPADVCRECGRMEAEIGNLKATDLAQWEEIKALRHLLYGVLVSSLVAAIVGIINLVAKLG